MPLRDAGASYLALLDRLVRAAGLLVACLGIVVLAGWFLKLPVLTSVLPGLATMKANTAVCFVAAALSLSLLRASPPRSRSYRVARGLALVVAIAGGLTLLEYLFNLDLHIDQLLVPDLAIAREAYPGRMAPVTAGAFLFLGAALFTLRTSQPSLARIGGWLPLVPLLFSVLAIVGYAYGVTSFYKVGAFAFMAFHTALATFVLSLAVLAADPTRGIANLLVSDTAGGLVTRRLLPTIPLALFALGWLRLMGQQAGLYDTAFGAALIIVSATIVSIFGVTSTALTLRRVDLRRERSEAAVAMLNAGLELRVEERTRQLARLSADLTAANTALEQLSLHDGLTELANRRFFDGYLATQVAIARRHDRPLALILCDIDDFKRFNDRYGHQSGDETLRQVAAALRTACRRPADMVARYGGEEFAIILPDTEMAGAFDVAEAARGAVEKLGIANAPSRAAANVTISGGVTVLAVGSAATVEELITAADQALFRAKDGGRNRMLAAGDEPTRKRA